MDKQIEKPGLADRDDGERITKILFWAFGGGAIVFSIIILLMFGLMAVAEAYRGSDNWWILIAAGVCTVGTLWVVLALAIWITSRLASGGHRERKALGPIQNILGGEFTKPGPWQIGARASLKVMFGSERARLSYHMVKSTAFGSAVAAVSDTETAKLHGENYRRFRPILTMRTNQKAPFKLVFVSRTKMAGAFSRMQEVQLSTYASTGIAAFTTNVEKASAILADEEFCKQVQIIIESNIPHISQLQLTTEGALWQTQMTTKVDANLVRFVFDSTGQLIRSMRD